MLSAPGQLDLIQYLVQALNHRIHAIIGALNKRAHRPWPRVAASPRALIPDKQAEQKRLCTYLYWTCVQKVKNENRDKTGSKDKKSYTLNPSNTSV